MSGCNWREAGQHCNRFHHEFNLHSLCHFSRSYATRCAIRRDSAARYQMPRISPLNPAHWPPAQTRLATGRWSIGRQRINPSHSLASIAATADGL